MSVQGTQSKKKSRKSRGKTSLGSQSPLNTKKKDTSISTSEISDLELSQLLAVSIHDLDNPSYGIGIK